MKKRGPKVKALKPNAINRRFASNFRQKRGQKTFEELSKETGIPTSTLNKMENGFTLPRTEESWIKLAQALKTTIDFLFTGEDEKRDLTQQRRQSYRRKEDRDKEAIIKNLNPETKYELKISIDTDSLKDIISKITA
jgi:transcriptional regulator with XRE-family HTH domain